LCIEQVAAKADFPACQVDIVQICCRYVHLLSACTHAGTGENATHACSAMSAEKETLLEFPLQRKMTRQNATNICMSFGDNEYFIKLMGSKIQSKCMQPSTKVTVQLAACTFYLQALRDGFFVPIRLDLHV